MLYLRTYHSEEKNGYIISVQGSCDNDAEKQLIEDMASYYINESLYAVGREDVFVEYQDTMRMVAKPSHPIAVDLLRRHSLWYTYCKLIDAGYYPLCSDYGVALDKEEEIYDLYQEGRIS